LSSPDADLALLCAAVQEGGALALGHFRRPLRHWEKEAGAGPVSEADLAVDALLHERLRGARPSYGWLSEETEDDPAQRAHDTVFVVDPIDGTRAFVGGRPGWCVAAAVVTHGAVTAAAAYLPVTGELYAASLGGGATLNGAPLEPSPRHEPVGALVLTGAKQMAEEHWPGGAPMVERAFRPSLVHRLCLVAGGGADAVLTFRPCWEWDIAPGALIATEAGCTVTDSDGRPLRFNATLPRLPGIMVAPPALHDALMARRRGPRARR
jgi:myo-inositol-1(or 4)-monophosphatase